MFCPSPACLAAKNVGQHPPFLGAALCRPVPLGACMASWERMAWRRSWSWRDWRRSCPRPMGFGFENTVVWIENIDSKLYWWSEWQLQQQQQEQ